MYSQPIDTSFPSPQLKNSDARQTKTFGGPTQFSSGPSCYRFRISDARLSLLSLSRETGSLEGICCACRGANLVKTIPR